MQKSQMIKIIIAAVILIAAGVMILRAMGVFGGGAPTGPGGVREATPPPIKAPPGK